MESDANAGRLDKHMAAHHHVVDRDDPKGKKPAVKKRTKTGCLTCRKRRIKCDENKPICKNCVKSKRECEGYNQRVVFKDPMGAQQGHFAPALYANNTPFLGDPLASHQARPPAPMPLQAIAPKPSPFDFGHSHLVSPQHQHHTASFTHGQAPPGGYPSFPNPLMPSPFPPDHEQGPCDGSGSQYGYTYHHMNVGEGPSSANRPRAIDTAAFAQPSNGLLHSQENDFDGLPSDDNGEMAESDDEQPDPRTLLASPPYHLTWPTPQDGNQVRTFSAFAQEQALYEYMSFAPNSELQSHAMRTIFRHFVTVTGPSMSLYDRDCSQTEEPAQFDANAELGNYLFSYKFPVLAWNHPGLLHAIMAIASLQIAKLRGTPATEALKHYHLSIRRIAKNVKTPLGRTKLSTLAATLLLAYFEVWSSDHTKWCSHLFGARLLFREIALRDMSRLYLPAKKLRWLSTGDPGKFSGDIDYQLLSTITGMRVLAEDYGLGEGQALDERCLYATDKDLDDYDILRDLFWWYAKMDVYQSILGGTKLFMGYEAWTQCPPRAPFSNIHAVYGTYDHLMLLLGRLANFTARDLARKRKMNRTPGANAGASSPPQFPGIVPTHGNFRVPFGFSPPMGHSPQTDSNDDSDALQSLEAAEQEWEGIRQGFEALENHLGPQFQDLKSGRTHDIHTPFGSALQYRTYSVAGIWMNYYMGLIHLYRSHPSMPPAAMQAAQLAAGVTAGFANQVGRIAAGLTEDCSRMPDVSTTLAAAFIESSFCLFVAAVQYYLNDQRCWVIQRMHDISRLTGWQSAMKIAVGCESAWLKACQLGHGPGYERPEHLEDVPVSVWLLPRRLDERISQHNQGEERRLTLVRSEQTDLAFGLLGVEGDLDRIHLQDQDES
ncbi:hypothetical protein G6O67_000779 [Ophiocordyceps sinensis]|uniref:Zn(2)-C6 fungal-type domain-containing protein n=1 Tax=Ophiocordyceps sinensis TaxID=72228 RepID=A0A8H4VAA9_9HYPO|nr:hypothetical protein G6O67_000779 [Ophiocordyceps sinensis]